MEFYDEILAYDCWCSWTEQGFNWAEYLKIRNFAQIIMLYRQI